MNDPKLHHAFDGHDTTLCGRPVNRARLADLSTLSKDEITCGTCARAFDAQFGDGGVR